MKLHEFLDFHFGEDGERELRARLANGEAVNEVWGPLGETPLHVAARRFRTGAVSILLDHGADIEAKTAGGKTAYVHAVRRGFDALADLLASRGAERALHPADRFAVAVVQGRLDDARRMLDQDAGLARTGNPEDDRLLADVAGRMAKEPVALLIAAGADLSAPGLDGGAPLHQAAWFGQPTNARLLIDACAPLNVFDATHQSSPIGWVAHGSRYSGDAENRQTEYVELAEILLQSGAMLNYPGSSQQDYLQRLLRDASPSVAERIRQHSS